jgi:hypothetical protein
MEQRLIRHESRQSKKGEADDVPIPLKLWTKKRTANVLQVEIKTLENWRVKGLGPPFVRLGGPRGRVFYRETDLRNYIESAVRNSTSDQGPLATNEN